jgi:2-polyprenyl-6-methoxyphenol hydroxylase-like FAD-dependent oxidoreductase
MHSPDLDVAIVGGGLVGLSLACALDGGGLRVALVDRGTPPAPLSDSPADWDVRVYAISPGSQAFLAGCGAWPDAARMAAVDAMQVYGDANGSRLAFDAHEARVAHLAQIVENRVLLDALWRRLRQSAVPVLAPVQSQAVAFEQDAAVLALEGQAPVRTRLLVAADGAQSWLRTQAGMPAATTPTHRAQWWPISHASMRTATARSNGSAPTACWRCCRCPATAARWCGPRSKAWRTS